MGRNSKFQWWGGSCLQSPSWWHQSWVSCPPCPATAPTPHPGKMCQLGLCYLHCNAAGWSWGRHRVCSHGEKRQEQHCFPCLHACGVTVPVVTQAAAGKLQVSFPKGLETMLLFKKNWYWKRKAGLESLSGNACRMQIFERRIAKSEWLLNHNKSYLAFLQCLSSYVLFTNINTWSSTTHLAKHCAVWELSHPSLVKEQTCEVSGDCPPHIRQDMCSSGWNTANLSAWVGRNLSLVALRIYLSRDLVIDPENEILKTAGDETNSSFPAMFFELFCVHPMHWQCGDVTPFRSLSPACPVGILLETNYQETHLLCGESEFVIITTPLISTHIC